MAVAAQPVDINALARANIRAQRARRNLTQASVARRMQQLGFGWYPQTVGLVERGRRPLLADELAALALCLETTPDVLALPPTDVVLVAFGEQIIPAQRMFIVDDSVSWDGDDLKVTPPTETYRPADLRAAVLATREALAAGRLEQGSDAEDLPPGWRPPETTE